MKKYQHSTPITLATIDKKCTAILRNITILREEVRVSPPCFNELMERLEYDAGLLHDLVCKKRK